MNQSSISPLPSSPTVVPPLLYTNEERWLALISYASIGCFIPLILKPKSDFCQWHGRQGLVLFIVTIIILFLLAITPGLGLLLFLAYFALIVIAMWRAYNGEKWAIPVVAQIAGKINLNKLQLPALSTSEAKKTSDENISAILEVTPKVSNTAVLTEEKKNTEEQKKDIEKEDKPSTHQKSHKK